MRENDPSKAVTCEQLRPDVAWAVLREQTAPCHPDLTRHPHVHEGERRHNVDDEQTCDMSPAMFTGEAPNGDNAHEAEIKARQNATVEVLKQAVPPKKGEA